MLLILATIDGNVIFSNTIFHGERTTNNEQKLKEGLLSEQ